MRMTLLFLAAAVLASAAQAPAPPNSAATSPSSCPAGNAAPAVTCRALASQAAGDFAAAAAAFEQLAAILPAADPKRDRAMAAAGNMWIAAGEPGKAALALDRALAGAGLQADQRGEALLDRARAAEAQNDLKTARARLTEAARTAGEQPFLWYFSAALAIREGDAAEARRSINRALALAPEDPLILFEAGHVAQFEGDTAGARTYWARAAAKGDNPAVAEAARSALALLGTPTVEKAPAPPR
jgi:tetratricopeptide (TPR) repeat protein